MTLCTHGVQTGEGYECSSCVTSPTFAEQLAAHLRRLAAERPAPVTPAEERTGVSDVQAEVLEQVEALRQEIGSLVIAARRDETLTLLLGLDRIEKLPAHLDRIEAAVRRGEQR